MTPTEIGLILDDYVIEDLHEILIRDGLYLPARGGHWLTKKLMLAMWRGEIYCPQYVDLKLRPCPRPPPRYQIVAEVNKEIASKFKSQTKYLVTTQTRMPEQKWLLEVLSTLNSDHRFFHKSWSPDRIMDPYLEVKMSYLRGQIDLTNPIFNDLPPMLLIRRKSLKGIAPSQF